MRRSCQRLALVLLALCGTATTARAQGEGNPANWCRNGAFTRDSEVFGLARVRGEGGPRLYFYGEEDGCPGPAVKCRQKAYLIPGDEVVTSRRFGDWVCAWYQPARGAERVGWLAADRLAPVETNAPPLDPWLGTWNFYDNEVRLSRGRRAGGLSVSGEATWVGVNPDNVHVGELAGEAAPAAGILKLGGEDEYDCRATLRLVGTYLLVTDNKQCGGVNVTFDGVYRKKK